ncbi:hypothetical protein Pelo_18139, partial [Pelomyxa schiedti]
MGTTMAALDSSFFRFGCQCFSMYGCTSEALYDCVAFSILLLFLHHIVRCYCQCEDGARDRLQGATGHDLVPFFFSPGFPWLRITPTPSLLASVSRLNGVCSSETQESSEFFLALWRRHVNNSSKWISLVQNMHLLGFSRTPALYKEDYYIVDPENASSFDQHAVAVVHSSLVQFAVQNRLNYSIGIHLLSAFSLLLLSRVSASLDSHKDSSVSVQQCCDCFLLLVIQASFWVSTVLMDSAKILHFLPLTMVSRFSQAMSWLLHMLPMACPARIVSGLALLLATSTVTRWSSVTSMSVLCIMIPSLIAALFRSSRTISPSCSASGRATLTLPMLHPVIIMYFGTSMPFEASTAV